MSVATKFTRLLVKAGLASETADLLQVQDAAGNVLWNVGAHGYGAQRVVTVSLTATQIKALRATPATLVAAPGTGKMLEFVSAVLELRAGTNVLTESTDNLAIRYNNGSGVQVSQAIETTGFIDQSADTVTNAQPKIDAIAAATGCDNKALVLHNTGDGEFGGNAAGDAVLKVRIAYRVHPTT